MQVQTKHRYPIVLQKLQNNNIEKLCTYLQQLSAETVLKFKPHPFSKQQIEQFYSNPLHIGFIAIDVDTCNIIGYAVIKIGYLNDDQQRLNSYGIGIHTSTDCTFAPSVADAWQSQGVGSKLFTYLQYYLKNKKINRILLWGGVQSSNTLAIAYYTKKGFKPLGKFEHNGENIDMIAEVNYG